MTHFSTAVRLTVTAAFLTATFPTLPAAADSTNKPTAAMTAFAAAWAKVDNYSESIAAHETTNDGKSSQDRTY
ncbi:MAG: hypothetical protein IAI50_02335, partial [Candidatus Eremiobacteraeota bacterium]|nr:hypothetical protein [Candidatus Eremiobacteraeota bacterium]